MFSAGCRAMLRRSSSASLTYMAYAGSGSHAEISSVSSAAGSTAPSTRPSPSSGTRYTVRPSAGFSTASASVMPGSSTSETGCTQSSVVVPSSPTTS